jgi:methionyl-tRNA formyltransferase
MNNLRIVFMGTPEFAVASLHILVKNDYNIVGVVTVADKPAGRGQQLQQSAVKKYAEAHNLRVLQPENLKAESFLAELKTLKADLQIVVAFRMLPEVVWNMPPLGTFNLHASLLPRYRGAAPINWAIINGDSETGVTTFFLQHQIDTGNIIFREKTSINKIENAGELHDRLMLMGAALVLKTVKAIETNNVKLISQDELLAIGEIETHAPKLFKENCKIDWTKNGLSIYNFIRGLNPYPTPFTYLVAPSGNLHSVKIFKTSLEFTNNTTMIGSIHTDQKTYLKVAVLDAYIHILELQLAGKKRIGIAEFLRGFTIEGDWTVV